MVDAASIPSAGGCRGGPGAGRGESIGRARPVEDTTGGPMITGRPSKLKGFRAEARATLPADLNALSCPSHSHQRRQGALRTAGDTDLSGRRVLRRGDAERGQGIAGEAVDGPLAVRPRPE